MDLTSAMRRLLMPIVRVALARGLRFQDLSDLLKQVFVDVACRDFALENRRPTVSRVSLLTGLQRRDVKERLGVAAVPPMRPNILARALVDWPQTAQGPDVLSREEFEDYVRGLSKDVHPRTVLDELVAQGLVERTEDGIRALTRALVAPASDATMLEYYAANAGDHLSAGGANVLAAPSPGPFLDRAVHYDTLTEASVAALQAFARTEAEQVLLAVQAHADKAQKESAGQGNYRIRFGTYFFFEEQSQ